VASQAAQADRAQPVAPADDPATEAAGAAGERAQSAAEGLADRAPAAEDGLDTSVATASETGADPSDTPARAAAAGTATTQEPSVDDRTPVAGGGQGARDGVGQGGVLGTVSSIADTGLTVSGSDGMQSEYAIDEATLFVLESTVDPLGVVAGELVRVQFPFAGATAEDGIPLDTTIASVVTVLPPETDISAPARAATQGTVVAAAEGGLMLTLPDGTNTLIPTDATTRFIRNATLDRTVLQVGDQVRVQLPRGAAVAEGTTAATRVTVVAPDPVSFGE
jgi:hypothetical protein